MIICVCCLPPSAFATSSDVNAIAIDAGVVEGDVTLIDPDAETHAASFFYPALRSAIVRWIATATQAAFTALTKFCEDSIAGGVNDASAMLLES